MPAVRTNRKGSYYRKARCITRGIPIGMPELSIQDFLNTPPCPFRRVSLGQAYCTISTDEIISAVDPLACHNCEVPGIISKPQCRYLSLGTEIKHFRGAGKVVPAVACRELNINIYNIEKTCGACKLCDPVADLAKVFKSESQSATLEIPVSEEVIAQIAKDINLEYGVREDDSPPLKEMHCWRFPEGKCRKNPIYTEGKVTVILQDNNRNNAIYRQAIAPALKDLNLQAYRITKPLEDSDQMCRACENMLEGDFVIVSLDDWDSASLFICGVSFGAGRGMALLKDSSSREVPLLESLASYLVEYGSIQDLYGKLTDHFSPLLVQGMEK